jgi:TonB-linked SusC/RagA family outer membrane protein
MMKNRLPRGFLAGLVTAALVVGASAHAWAQSPTMISGRVVNETGAPTGGATIGIEGTTVSTLSNSDGRYALTVPGSQRGPVVVTLRLIGYKLTRQTVTLAGQPVTLNWLLNTPITTLTGVVVTALNIQREKATIGTSQQALAGEELTRVKAPSVISSLSGKVSGVAINQSGNMGGSSRLVIRGAGSILGENQPLFIVDGLPVSNRGFSTASASGGRDYGTAISDLNPDDIATVTVLKGPNAAALYGSRASNGAVVITTRTGRGAQSGITFNLTSRMSADQLSVLPDYQNQYGQGFAGEFQYVDGAGSGINDGADESWGPKLDGRPIDQFFGKQQPWIAHPNNVRDFFQTGRTISNSVNATMSGSGMGARLSLTKDNIVGIVPNSRLAKLSGMLSASAQVKEKLNLSGSLNYVQNRGLNRAENGYTEGNPMMTFTWFGRQVDVQSLRKKFFNTNNPYGFPDGSLYNWNDNYHRNPYWQQFDNLAPDSRDRIIAQMSATYEVAPWLSGLLRVGGDSYRQTQEEQFARGNIDRASASFNGGFSTQNSRARETNVDGLLTARKNLGMFDVTLNAGGSQRRNERFNNGYSTAGILVEKIYNLANAGIAPTFTNEEFHTAVNSAYGSAIVTVNEIWTVEATGRNDWSSTLPKENASYFYPSVSSALVVSDLFPSLVRNGWLTYVKVRGGLAQVGSDAAPYQLQTLYSGSSNKFFGAALYTLDNTSANAALKPERTTGAEGGLEFSLFNDRVTVDGTYYVKKTRDQIIPLTIAPATGFSRTVINAGQITNRGFETMVTARLVRGNNFHWSSTLNYTRNRNRVDELAPGLATIIIASQWGANIEARRGEPYGVLFGYGYQRDSATGQLLLSGGLPLRGTAKKILGNVNPDWVGGWSNELRYKRLTLNTLIDVRHGGQNFSIGNWWGMYAGILKSTLKGREEDWDKPGLVIPGIDKASKQPNTTRVTAEDWNHSVYPINEAGIFNTGFAKLREVRLSWDAPSRFAAKARLSDINLAFVGRNLYTWTKFPNYDPENASNAGNGGQGFDMGALPTTRSFGLNISLTP